jgi:hypothetical protein
MHLDTLGHATLLLASTANSAPHLVTDPWLLGSCYWRSWWLERYPSNPQIDRISTAQYCYLTHEHPDHFHTPSLRRIGAGPEYLVPELSGDRMGTHLRAHGNRARCARAGSWIVLGDGLRILSIPTLGNDSALLIDTEHALIANMNDARPTPDQLALLRRVRRGVGRGKRCVLLASYSSAGIGHSLFRNGERLAFANGRHARYVALLARVFEADMYIPFASHVRFERDDTRWANAYRVPTSEVSAALAQVGVVSLPPYVSLDLASFEYRTQDSASAGQAPDVATRVRAQVAGEASALDRREQALLERKLRAAGRLWLPLLFPRGIRWRFPGQYLHYDTVRGRVSEQHCSGPASVEFRLPAQAVKDVLTSGFLSDLCIPMFTEVHLAIETLPQAVYAFFVLMQLHDVGALGDARALTRSLTAVLSERLRLLRSSARNDDARCLELW